MIDDLSNLHTCNLWSWHKEHQTAIYFFILAIAKKIVKTDGSIRVQLIVCNFSVDEIADRGNIFDGLLEDLGIEMS